MALANLAVTCGYIGEDEHATNNQNAFGRAVWSENIAAGTTSQAAPIGKSGRPVFQIVAAADSWVVTGATALNAALAVSTKPSEARMFVKAATVTNIYVNPGDKLAWVAA